jgi:hypothetical protein
MLDNGSRERNDCQNVQLYSLSDLVTVSIYRQDSFVLYSKCIVSCSAQAANVTLQPCRMASKK